MRKQTLKEITALYDYTDFPKRGLEPESYPLLGEVDCKPKILQVVEAGGSQYAVCFCSGTAAGVKPCTITDAPEVLEFENGITCPYCGFVERDSFEYGDSGETVCGRCGAKFEYERVVMVEYSTWPVAPPKILRGRWVKRDG